MSKCPGCGAELLFSPEKQCLVCSHCGNEVSVNDPVLKDSENLSSARDLGADEYQTMVYTCPNCGGRLLSTAQTAVTFCSYCGSSVVLEGRLTNEHRPDRIIPFMISRDQCRKAYKRMARKAIFAPGYYKNDTEIDKFRGIYMPYWIYDFAYSGDVSIRSSTSRQVGDFLIKNTYLVTDQVSMTYNDVSFDAASNFSDSLSQAVSPFQPEKGVDFNTAYLSGFYADQGDVDSRTYQDSAQQLMKDYFMDSLCRMPGDRVRYGVTCKDIEKGLNAAVPSVQRRVRQGLFPVWFLASRNRDQKHISYAVVNGQTGAIAADLPVSYWKYLLGTAILAIPIFLLLNGFLTLTPVRALFIAIFLGIISFFLLNRELTRTLNQEQGLDDKGYQAANPRKKNKLVSKTPILIWPILGLVVAFLVLFWDPVEDYWYYIGASFTLLTTFWAVFQLIVLHNRQTLRKLPQFEKRGGDYNA